MLNLEEKIVDHAARQLDPSGAQQPANNEITVPAVHLIEASAGNDVFILQIEQAVRLNLAGIDFSEMMNLLRQVLNLHVAVGRQFLYRRWVVKTRRARLERA